MLTIALFRQEKERVLQGLQKRNFKELELVDQILATDERRRALQAENDRLAATINAASKEIGQLMARGEKEAAEQRKAAIAEQRQKVKELSAQLAETELQLEEALLRIPNLPHESVPAGKSAEDNEIVRAEGEKPALGAEKRPHWDLATQYRLIDFEVGTKITGSGFPVYTGQGARLQRALITYFLDYNTRAGYYEYYPPYLVNEASAHGTGQLPDKEGQMYHVALDNFYLIPTAEVPVTNIYRDEIVPAEKLPVKMTAYTPCFRREAGSYGKDVRGLNRLHQFDKVEIVQLTRPADSYAALEDMVAHVAGLLRSLELPFRILRLCGGDMGFTSALTYDFEVWSAAQERWLEVSSVSNFESFQTNRMKIRYRNEQGKTELLHSLNGSSLALPRILAALLENHQTAEGIRIPEALQPYFGSHIIR